MTNPLSPIEIAEKAKRIYADGEYILAARSFSEAAGAYAAAGDPLMAAEMNNNQSVALLRAKDAQAALEAAQDTDKIFAKSSDHRRQGMALANQASALEALKRSREAIDYYKNAGDALALADEGDLRAQVMQLLSMLYLRRFRFYEAVIALQSGLSGVKNPTPKQRFMKKIMFIRL
jgi:tetratricopeptide (TPR) repeat protein